MKNRKSLALILAVVVSAIPGLGMSVPAQAVDNSQRLIVTFADGAVQRGKSAVERAGAAPVKELPFANSLVVTAPNSAVADRLKSLNGVERVEVDARVFVTAPPKPSQPAQTLTWGVDRIDAEKSWGTSRGAGVKVAVIDTGIDKSHPDLVGNVIGGVNFAKGPATAWNDDNGHGTHVAGTIAALDNGIGVVGVAPEADLYGVKVLDRNGSGYASDVALGIDWSVTNKMQVISMSLGENSDVTVLRDAVARAASEGVIMVAAAGNSGDGDPGTDNVLWPAKYDSVIAVSATDSSDKVASFSSDGDKVELAAPGVSVLSTTRGGGYGTMSGTSMATPHVSGVVAAMLASGVTASDIRAKMQTTADDLGTAGRDVFYGYGLVDAEEAVTGVQSAP